MKFTIRKTLWYMLYLLQYCIHFISFADLLQLLNSSFVSFMPSLRYEKLDKFYFIDISWLQYWAWTVA